MDIVTIIGIVLAIVGVGVGMVLKGVPVTALNNPAAILIILVGTVAAVTIATPGPQLKKVPKLFGIIFGNNKVMTKEEAIKIMVEFSELTRKEGILALESKLKSIDEPFIVRGLSLLVDGADSQYVAEILEEDIMAMETRHANNAQIFAQGGMYAPTLGVLGAVIGLIAALRELDDIEAIGHAISAAFVATLLGIFTGYVLWHPFANRLKQKSKAEVAIKRLIVEGILGICEGQNPRMLKERMLTQIAQYERTTISKE